MQIKLLVDGGSMKPGPALSQKLGPAGIPINKVIEKINEETKNFKGMKVPVELEVNTKTKTFEIQIFSPPVSELLKKEIGATKGSGAHKKQQIGNISIEQVISVAKTKMPNLLCRSLKTATSTVAGTCASLGILIENKSAIEVVHEINQGKYDKEIKEEKTNTEPEKRERLDKHFKDVKKAQDILLAQEKAAQDAKEVKEVKK